VVETGESGVVSTGNVCSVEDDVAVVAAAAPVLLASADGGRERVLRLRKGRRPRSTARRGSPPPVAVAPVCGAAVQGAADGALPVLVRAAAAVAATLTFEFCAAAAAVAVVLLEGRRRSGGRGEVVGGRTSLDHVAYLKS
jgi:hypothetical protein